MTFFESKHFSKFKFTPDQIKQYFANASRDFKIAAEDPHMEVQFNYCYNALIKGGIALIAATGGVKARSIPGHHIKILEKMSEIMKDDLILTMGNTMRMKRNEDFYHGGTFISEKEVLEYLGYVKNVLAQIKKLI